MRSRTRAKPPRKLLPFADAPPAMLNYYIYVLTMIAFSVVAWVGNVPLTHFLVHAGVSVLVLVLFNFFIHCMVHGGCTRASVLIVTLLQVAHVVLFVVTATAGAAA